MLYLIVEPEALEYLLPTEGRYEVKFQAFNRRETGSRDFSLLRAASEADQLIVALHLDQVSHTTLIPPAVKGDSAEWREIQHRAASVRDNFLKDLVRLLRLEGVTKLSFGVALASKRPTYGEINEDVDFLELRVDSSEISLVSTTDARVSHGIGELRTFPTTGDSIVILRTDFEPDGLEECDTVEELALNARELIKREPWSVHVAVISVAQVVEIGRRLDE